MSYASRSGRAFTDPSSPRAYGVCDRCGAWVQHYTLQSQREWAGTTIIDLGVLCCDRCLDDLQPQLRTIILPPDPQPIINARVEQFSLDEAGPTQYLNTEMDGGVQPGSYFYLDIYNGDPDLGGASVLEDLTGSATRTNVASVMSVNRGYAANTSVITLTESAENTVNAYWVVMFSAASGGTRLMDGEMEPPETITEENGAAFAVGHLQALLTGCYVSTQSGGFLLMQDGSSYVALQGINS